MKTNSFSRMITLKVEMLLCICLMISGCAPNQSLRQSVAATTTGTAVPTETGTQTETVVPTTTLTEAVVPTNTPIPISGPSILPKSLYFLSKDNNGVDQIYRIEKDGETLHEVTSESFGVLSFELQPGNGNIVYVSADHSLLLANSDGSGRQVILDPQVGGQDAGEFIITPVWSPDGQTIAFGHSEQAGSVGLSFYSMKTRAIDWVSLGTSSEIIISPQGYSPDGDKLFLEAFNLVDFSDAYYIYLLEAKKLLYIEMDLIGCCSWSWNLDGTGLYLGKADGLWYVSASNGEAKSLVPTGNFIHVAPDGQLYYLNPDLVRSGSDGVTGLIKLVPALFPLEDINEVLWSPDLSLAVLVRKTDVLYDNIKSGEAVIAYANGKLSKVLTGSAYHLRWGP